MVYQKLLKKLKKLAVWLKNEENWSNQAIAKHLSITESSVCKNFTCLYYLRSINKRGWLRCTDKE